MACHDRCDVSFDHEGQLIPRANLRISMDCSDRQPESVSRVSVRAALCCLFLLCPAGLRAAPDPFPSVFRKLLFCAVSVPTVSRTIGKSWSAKELGDRFRHAVDAVIAEGRKQGLTEKQVYQALDEETARQQAAIAGGRKADIARLYVYCR